MKPIRWLAIPAICAAILGGCETLPPAPTALPPVSPGAAEQAERDGEYLLAAREYTRRAETGALRGLSPALLAEINGTRAQAELALDNPVGAARNLIAREQYIVEKNAVAENQQQLWKMLVSQPRARLATEFNMARDRTLSGWLELGLIAGEN